MFVTAASVDDNEEFVERDYDANEISTDLVVGLIKSLDGRRHTLVTLSPGGEAHMAIGGDANEGMVVYVTSDNMTFYNLHTAAQRPVGEISLVAGGQPGDYDARAVVTLEEALLAATQYSETGERASELYWDMQE